MSHIGMEQGKMSGIGTESTMIAGFVRINPRDLNDGDVAELLVGPLSADGGIDEAFSITWRPIRGHVLVRLSSHSDAWSGLVSCAPLLRMLADIRPDCTIENPPTPEEVVSSLVENGCLDLSRPPRYPRAGDPR